MAAAAYLFINVKTGLASKALQGIRKINEVKQAHMVTGLHDIIAYIEASDVNALGQTVITKIHQVDGIDRTITCVAVQE